MGTQVLNSTLQAALKNDSGPGEDGSVGYEVLALQTQGLELAPWNPCKKAGMVEHVCSRGAEEVGYLGLFWPGQLN